MPTHQTSNVKLRIHLHKCFVGDKASCFTLIVRLAEIAAFHYLQPEELHEINIYGQHFHKHLLAIYCAAPPHLLVGNYLSVTKSHGFYGRILQQVALQGIFLASGRLSAPDIKDMCLFKTHVFVHHESCLYSHEECHQDKQERQHELNPHKYIAKCLTFHAGSIGTFQYKCSRLRSRIHGRSNACHDCRNQCYSQHED